MRLVFFYLGGNERRKEEEHSASPLLAGWNKSLGKMTCSDDFFEAVWNLNGRMSRSRPQVTNLIPRENKSVLPVVLKSRLDRKQRRMLF